MKTRIVRAAALALAAFFCAAGVASAQMTKPVNLTPKEQAEQADGFLAKMENGRRTISSELQRARASRDVVKTLCLSDKLTQIDVAIRSAHERRQELGSAALAADADRATHEFTILTVLRLRAEELIGEANICRGSIDVIDESTDVKKTIEGNLPDEDPSKYPEEQVIVDVPSCSSCYM